MIVKIFFGFKHFYFITSLFLGPIMDLRLLRQAWNFINSSGYASARFWGSEKPSYVTYVNNQEKGGTTELCQCTAYVRPLETPYGSDKREEAGS